MIAGSCYFLLVTFEFQNIRRKNNIYQVHQNMSDKGFYNKSILSTASISRTDSELENKVKKTSERICENLHIIANEPSLAFYRIAEHVRKALPPTVDSRSEVKRLNQQLQGAYFDAEYGLETVKSMDKAAPHLNNIQELLKNAIFLQQQLKYEQSRKNKRDSGSLYQRFSSHLTSVDLPDLGDIRVDSVIGGSGGRERANTGPSNTGS